MANKERVRLNISVIQCLFLLSKVQCICLARMFLNMTLYLSVTMTKISYTKRFRLLGKMEHLCGYIMRLYGDLNCVIKNRHYMKSKIELQWCTCVLELHLACIFDLTTGRKVCPRSWPPTSTKIPRVKSSLVSTPVSVNNRHPISSMDTLSNKINQQISCCRTTIKEFGRRMKGRLLVKSNREKENSQDDL